MRGRLTLNRQPLPGRGRDADRAAVRVHQRVDDRQAQPGATAGRGRATSRRGRTARTPAARRRLLMPGPSSHTSSTALSSSVPTRTVMPALSGVCCSALATRLPSTCRSRASSPSTSGVPGPSNTSMVILRSRRDRLRVVHGVAGQRQQVDAAPFERALLRRAGPAAAGPRRAAPIRLDSLSMRLISISTSRAAPWRYSSAKPRIVVSGVRSSWLASVMNRRIRSSERRACSADASDDATARWICASIPLSANDSRPTSVRGSRSGTRRSSSPGGDRRGGLLHLDQRTQAAVHHRVADDAEHQQHRRADADLRRRSARAPSTGRRTGRSRRWSARRAARAPSSPATARRSVDRADRHRHGSDVVVGGQRGFGRAVVDRHPDAAVGIDAAHVEVRRRPAGLGPSIGGAGIRRGACAQPREASSSVSSTRLMQVVLQDRGDRDAGREQAAGHQHQGGGDQPDPQRHASPAQCRHAPHCRRAHQPRFTQDVADAAQRVEQPLLAGVDLAAQVGHVGLDDVDVAAEVVAPHVVEDLGLARAPCPR